MIGPPEQDTVWLASEVGIGGPRSPQESVPSAESPPTNNNSIVRPDLYNAAREYAGRGWSVIPLIGKIPALRTWKVCQRVPVVDDASLAKWFSNAKVTGVGVILGGVSGGLFVRDFDDMGSYQRWSLAFPAFARTLPTVRTNRGFHVYGRWPGLATTTMADGELRAVGVYVAAPPSTHPTGAVYVWALPLPAGEVPEVDPAASGLSSTWVQETVSATERAESAEKAETTEFRVGGETHTPSHVLSLSNTRLSVSLCCAPDESDQIAHAIDATRPTAVSQRNRKLFAFARHLKAIPRLAALPVGQLKPFVRQWYNGGKGAIGTLDFDTTWGDFVRGWPKIRWAIGEGPLEKALSAAIKAELPEWAAEYESPGLRLLVKLCWELQRASGESPFFLSCRTAGQALGEDYGTTWRWFGVLEADGVLEVVERCPQGGRRANRYRFLRN